MFVPPIPLPLLQPVWATTRQASKRVLEFEPTKSFCLIDPVSFTAVVSLQSWSLLLAFPGQDKVSDQRSAKTPHYVQQILSPCKCNGRWYSLPGVSYVLVRTQFNYLYMPYFSCAWCWRSPTAAIPAFLQLPSVVPQSPSQLLSGGSTFSQSVRVTQYCDLWVFLPLIQQIIIMWLDGKKRARVLRPKIPLIAFIYRNYFSWIFFRCFEINNCAGIIWGNKGGADICERVRKGIEVDLENGSPALNEREPVNTIRVRTPVAEDEKEDLEDAETLRLYIRLSVNDWKVRWPYNIFQQLPESHFQLLWRGHTEVSV